MQLPGHYRLQRPRGEPVFDVPIGNLRPEEADRAEAPHDTADESATPAGVQAPPPAYTGLQLPLVRTTSSGRTLVNPTGSGRRSKATKIDWHYHPAISGKWYLYRLLRFLRRDRERLQTEFPEVFEEVLIEGNVDPEEQDKIRELFLARITHLNDWVLESLAGTRLWMALVEVSVYALISELLVLRRCPLQIIGLAILTYLVAALAITGGHQTVTFFVAACLTM